MLSAILILFTLYTLFKIYISVMEVGYVSQQKNQPPVLMSAVDYLLAARYKIAKERLSIIGALVEFLLFLFWLKFGFVWLYETFMLEDTINGAFMAVISFLAVSMVVTLPLDVYAKFGIDQKFGFNKSTVGLFVKDTLISALITVVVTYPIVAVVHSIILSSELWWLYTFVFLLGVLILVNVLFPIVRAKFFDKLTPLTTEPLKTRLEALFANNGFKNSGLFISDASKRDAKLNAYFAGMGPSKRVVLFDTLVEKLSIEELEAVLGHELGHYEHKDVVKNLAMMGGMLFTTLAIFGNIPVDFFRQIGVNPTSGIVMVNFLLLSSLLFFIMMPILGRLSRHNEFRADEEGSRLGGQENLISALKKLVSENKAFPKSHPIYLLFYATHPPVLERIEAMGRDVNNV